MSEGKSNRWLLIFGGAGVIALVVGLFVLMANDAPAGTPTGPTTPPVDRPESRPASSDRPSSVSHSGALPAARPGLVAAAIIRAPAAAPPAPAIIACRRVKLIAIVPSSDLFIVKIR